MRCSAYFRSQYDLYWVLYASTQNTYEVLEKIYEIIPPSDVLSVPLVLPVMPGYYVGPRPYQMTSWCSNVLSIFREANITGVERLERYRYTSVKPNIDILTEICFTHDASLAEIFDDKNSNSTVLTDGNVTDIALYAKENSLPFDESDLEFYSNLFQSRHPTKAEIHDLANSNSEHSRHWLFRAFFNFTLKDFGGIEVTTQQSMMDLIQAPLKHHPGNSLVAFSDNASAIKATGTVMKLVPNSKNVLQPVTVLEHISFTAETHNFPTGVSPFQGATTGTGGRIRDTQAIGRGGTPIAGTVGYCVGKIDIQSDGKISTSSAFFDRISPERMLLQASDGASDYGNKFGEPVIQGFCRSFGSTIEGQRIEWLKPIMFSGGIGHVREEHLYKLKPQPGWKVVRVGGPTYRIGIGGGAASSVVQSAIASDNEELRLLSAVQRGDAQTENRMDRWLRHCISLGNNNPIQAIHDQGAGGMANVTKEILDGVGGFIDLSRVAVSDASLSSTEIWISESQEQNTVLIKPEDIQRAEQIAYRERVHFNVIGEVQDTGRIQVINGPTSGLIVDLPLNSITPPPKVYSLTLPTSKTAKYHSSHFNSFNNLRETLSRIDVGSKRFLTVKVDRSVGGLIAQQQCVGPLHTPLANVAVIANDFYGYTGAATAIGERPIINGTIAEIEQNIRWSIYEMLTNLVWASVTDLHDVKCSGNWMWPAQTPEGKAQMLHAVKVASDTLIELGIAVDGGKDSVSMSAKLRSGETVNSPNSFVVSGYVPCPDIRLIVRPGFQRNDSVVLYIPTQSSALLVNAFKTTQRLLTKFLSGHDVSDGGLITTICEMCFASDHGHGISLTNNILIHLNDESPGLVIEVSYNDLNLFISAYDPECEKDNPLLYRFPERCIIVGYTQSEPCITVASSSTKLPLHELRDAWELPSTSLDKLQTLPAYSQIEHDYLISWTKAPRTIEWPCSIKATTPTEVGTNRSKLKVAIIRGEGSNGDREMAAALYCAGFEVHDITTTDLTDGRIISLQDYCGIVFPGGFTYADALGSAGGWETVLTRNSNASKLLQDFRQRDDTFVLGVCNGCQLLARLGWIEGELHSNLSGRFESRFVTVRVEDPGAERSQVWLHNLIGSRLGVWVAHGEGRFTTSECNTDAFRYVNPHTGTPTEEYPFNPNGSVEGTAGRLSEDGRILAMMPHPERCFKMWQLPWCPPAWRECYSESQITPWLTLFQNAHEWASKRGGTF